MNFIISLALISSLSQVAGGESLESKTIRESCELAWSHAAKFCAEPAAKVTIPPESDFERRANVYGWLLTDAEFRLERCQRYVTNCQEFCVERGVTENKDKMANNKENCDQLDGTYLAELKSGHANAVLLSNAAQKQWASVSVSRPSAVVISTPVARRPSGR